MRLYTWIGAIAAAAALTVSAAAQTAPVAPAPPAPPAAVASWARYTNAREVQIRNFAGIVRIHPENRADVAVSFANAGPLSAPEFRRAGARLIVDGRQRRQLLTCRVRGENGFEVVVNRVGRLAADRLPVLEIRMPQDAVVTTAGSAVRMQVGASEALRLQMGGCGDANIARVERAAEVNVSGDAEIRLLEAGEATVTMVGDGDVTLGFVHNGLTASLTGDGDLTVARSDGATNIAVQGDGGVVIRDGHASLLSVVIAGEGDVTHNGEAQRLDAVILGSGDVRVHRVEGQVSQRVIGGGDVIVGR